MLCLKEVMIFMGFLSQVVYFYGDSQLRSFIDGPSRFLDNFPVITGFNCTPGGRCRHISIEVAASKPPKDSPDVVFIEAGTNNVFSRTSLIEDKEELRNLITTTRAKFPKSNVSCEVR